MSKHSGGGVNVGSSSILLIFVLLCLTTFATLSLVSANADYKLTKKSAGAVQAYYEADAIGERVLQDIDDQLLKAAEASSTPAEYYKNAAQLIYTVDWVIEAEVASETALHLYYEVPIDENRTLQVRLQALYPQNGGSRCQVTGWSTVFTGEWEGSEDLQLWEGE